MYAWRPVLEHVASRREIEEAWSLDDLEEAHEALDAWIEARRKAEQSKG